MADNTTINTGSGGDTIRTEDRTTYKTPVSLIDVGGSSSEALIGDGTNAMPIKGIVAASAVISTQNPVVTGLYAKDFDGAALPGAVDAEGDAVHTAGSLSGVQYVMAVNEDGSAVGTVNATCTNAGTFAVQAAQSGTWTVEPGNTANTTAWLVTGTGGTFPVTDSGGSLTVDAPVGTPVFVRLSDGSAAITNLQVNNNQVAGNTISTGNGTAGTGVQRVAICSDNTAFSVNATGPTLTKGTQGSTGFSVQNLKDAGRTNLRYYATAVAAGTTGTETAITLTKSSGTSATSTGTSHTPTSGKTFRIIAIVFAARGHNTATAQVTTFNLRVNTAGAVTTTSTPIILAMRVATPATANSWDRALVSIPDGIEIAGDGTLQFGVTAAATYTTNAPTWDVTIIGFEY